MIAPARPPLVPSRRRLEQARRLAAEFLPASSTTADEVPAWQAWLLAGWVLFTTAYYLVSMLR